jgi:xylulokinase
VSDDVLVLGVDSSTQSTKAVLHRISDGAVVASGTAPHPRTSPPVSEQDPAAWWAALEAACAALPAELRARVGAVAVAAQQHGAVLVDAGGVVVRPAKLWNDTEAAPEAAELVARLGAEAWADAAGSVPLAAFTIAKLAWVARHEPAALAATATVLLPHDWLSWRLTGSATTDRGDASGTGYWSPGEERWRPDLLALVADRDWDSALPRVLAPDEPAGTLRADAAAALGLPGGIPVGPGTGDNMAAALSLGIGPGDLAVSIGTSGTVFSVSTSPVRDPTGLVAGFADATGRHLPLACTLNAALVTDAVARLLGVDHVGLEALWADAPAGADGVVLVPWLDGERTPDRPGATGLLTGFRSDVRREQLARAAFEGVVCGLLAAADAIEAAGVPTGSGVVALVGGGARSAAYRSTLADLSGRPVVVADRDEHVAAGAAIQAAAVLTGRPPVDVAAAWRPPERVRVDPDPTVDAVAIRSRYAAATRRA